jgi:hypothetical protein
MDKPSASKRVSLRDLKVRKGGATKGGTPTPTPAPSPTPTTTPTPS